MKYGPSCLVHMKQRPDKREETVRLNIEEVLLLQKTEPPTLGLIRQLKERVSFSSCNDERRVRHFSSKYTNLELLDCGH